MKNVHNPLAVGPGSAAAATSEVLSKKEKKNNHTMRLLIAACIINFVYIIDKINDACSDHYRQN
jgi:hypothetical protein